MDSLIGTGTTTGNKTFIATLADRGRSRKIRTSCSTTFTAWGSVYWRLDCGSRYFHWRGLDSRTRPSPDPGHHFPAVATRRLHPINRYRRHLLRFSQGQLLLDNRVCLYAGLLRRARGCRFLCVNSFRSLRCIPTKLWPVIWPTIL